MGPKVRESRLTNLFQRSIKGWAKFCRSVAQSAGRLNLIQSMWWVVHMPYPHQTPLPFKAHYQKCGTAVTLTTSWHNWWYWVLVPQLVNQAAGISGSIFPPENDGTGTAKEVGKGWYLGQDPLSKAFVYWICCNNCLERLTWETPSNVTWVWLRTSGF